LYKQDLAARCHCAIYAGDDDAGQKVNFEIISRCALDNAQQQAGGDEAVVKPLVRGQYLRDRRLLSGLAKGLETCRFFPKEHFQYQKIYVKQGYKKHGQIGGYYHCYTCCSLGGVLCCLLFCSDFKGRQTSGVERGKYYRCIQGGKQHLHSSASPSNRSVRASGCPAKKRFSAAPKTGSARSARANSVMQERN